ncbi:MAG: hypothetical protein HQL31_14135, partial [Planctomycetes bacterium]|nr:hypothetical protein [Planctomycetota bacterium]
MKAGIRVLPESCAYEVRPHRPNSLTLSFVDLPRLATQYTLLITADLLSKEGVPCKPTRIDFETCQPRLVEYRQVAVEPGQWLEILLGFDAQVNPELLSKHLELWFPNEKKTKFILHSAANSSKVVLRIEHSSYESLSGVIHKGLLFENTTISSKEDIPFSITLCPRLNFQSMNTSWSHSSDELGALDIRFNSPIEADHAKKYILIIPKVEFDLSSNLWGLLAVGKFEPGQNYLLEMAKGLPGGPAGRLQESIKRSFKFPDRPLSLKFRTGGGYLSPRGMMKVPIRSVNVRKMNFEARRLLRDNIVEFTLRDRYYMPDYLSGEVKKKIIRPSGTINSFCDTLISIDELFTGPKEGVYYMAVQSDGSHRRDDTIVAVTNLALSLMSGLKECRVFVSS